MIQDGNATMDFFKEMQEEDKNIRRACLLIALGILLSCFVAPPIFAISVAGFIRFVYGLLRESKLSNQMLAASQQDFVDFDNDMKLIQAQLLPGQQLH